MKDGLGSIRTGIQRQSGGKVAGARERSTGGGVARGCQWPAQSRVDPAEKTPPRDIRRDVVKLERRVGWLPLSPLTGLGYRSRHQPLLSVTGRIVDLQQGRSMSSALASANSTLLRGLPLAGLQQPDEGLIDADREGA